MTPRFVIVGTGRCGSGYISRVLTAAGIRCGHEDHWNPWGTVWADDLVGDSSWCALAMGLTDYQGLVFHQVRHPLDVVSSLVKVPLWGPYAELRDRLVPESDDDDSVRLAMKTWLALERAAEERSCWGWRCEDVDADTVAEVGARVGVVVGLHQVHEALADVPTNYNEHGQGHRYSWEELAEHDDVRARALRREAHKWGYE